MQPATFAPHYRIFLAALANSLTGIALAALCVSVVSVLHSGLLIVE